MDSGLVLALSLVVALVTIAVIALTHQQNNCEPEKETVVYWQVGNDVVGRIQDAGGDTSYSVNRRIIQKWDNEEPSNEKVIAVLRDYGVQVEQPWVLIDPDQLTLVPQG